MTSDEFIAWAMQQRETIVHHRCGKVGIILTRIVRDGPILLDSPGIALTDRFAPGVA